MWFSIYSLGAGIISVVVIGIEVWQLADAGGDGHKLVYVVSEHGVGGDAISICTYVKAIKIALPNYVSGSGDGAEVVCGIIFITDIIGAVAVIVYGDADVVGEQVAGDVLLLLL